MNLKTIKGIIDKPEEFLKEFNALESAMSGDIAFEITPATSTVLASAQNEADYVRTVHLRLKDSNGYTHTWYDGTLDITYGEVTAGNGAITGPATVNMVNGVAEVPVAYSGVFSAGVQQVETATVAMDDTDVKTTGHVAVTVTATGMGNTPKTINVAVTEGELPAEVAANIVTALNADADVSAMFTATQGTGENTADVILTRKKVNGIVVANISNLNIGLIDVDDEGITTAASSANTTAGVAADTNTVTLAAETINGVSITGGTSVETSIA